MRIAHALSGSVAVVLLVGACNSQTTAPVTAPPTTGAASTALPASTPSAEPSSETGVQTIKVASADAEPALRKIWQATGKSAAPSPCLGTPVIDGSGNLWVNVCWANSFWSFKPDGTFLDAWGSFGTEAGQFDFSFPATHDSIGGLAFAPDGSFYTFEAGNLRIQHFNAKREPLGSWGSFGTGQGQFVKPTSIAVGSKGEVFVADGGQGLIEVFSPEGTFLRAVGDGRAGMPDHFAWIGLDSADNVYVAEENRYVAKYAPDGMPILRIDLAAVANSGDATDTTVGPGGELFVTFTSDTGQHIRGFVELSPEGELLHRWPGIGEEALVVDDGAAVLATDNESEFLTKYALPKQ